MSMSRYGYDGGNFGGDGEAGVEGYSGKGGGSDWVRCRALETDLSPTRQENGELVGATDNEAQSRATGGSGDGGASERGEIGGACERRRYVYMVQDEGKAGAFGRQSGSVQIPEFGAEGV